MGRWFGCGEVGGMGRWVWVWGDVCVGRWVWGGGCGEGDVGLGRWVLVSSERHHDCDVSDFTHNGGTFSIVCTHATMTALF